MSRHRHERGVALLMTLLVLVVATSAALLLAAAHARTVALHLDGTRRLRLDALVDSAADATLARLAAEAGTRGLPPTAFGGGTISSDVRAAGEDLVTVDARAELAGIERRVRLKVRIGSGAPQVLDWRSLGLGPAGGLAP